MATEQCPECGHRTKVYSDAGRRQHYEGCSLGRKPMADGSVNLILTLNEAEFENLRTGVAGPYAPTMDVELTAEYVDGWEAGREATNNWIMERVNGC